MAPVVTPRPTCIGFRLDPPTVWLTRSWNVTELDLKPTVLMFARLFPITLRYVPFALRPERPAEKEPTAIMCAPLVRRRPCRRDDYACVVVPVVVPVVLPLAAAVVAPSGTP